MKKIAEKSRDTATLSFDISKDLKICIISISKHKTLVYTNVGS